MMDLALTERGGHRDLRELLFAAVLAGGMGTGPWPWDRPVTDDECRVAIEAGEVLGVWRRWPAAGGGLRIGIVVDTSTTMDPLAPCVTSLAWVLTLAAFASGRQAGRRVGPVRPVVIAAEETWDYSDPATADPPVLSTARASAHTESSISMGIARACSAVDLRTAGGARLLVVITDRRPRSVDSLQITELGRAGCGVLLVCPASHVTIHDSTPDNTPDSHDGAAFEVHGPDAVLQVIDPLAPINGRSLALSALDAMRRADRTPGAR